jgi:multidrug efflux pump
MMAPGSSRHVPPERQSASIARRSGYWSGTIAAYGRSLRWVLDHERATLVTSVAVLVLTIVLYVVVPKGSSRCRTPGDSRISEAPQSISFSAMAERQRALARVILADPAVQSLSRSSAVDGTNVTLNSGRILVNLKPLAERKTSATDVIRRLEPRLAAVEGIHLYLQAVQDLTVTARVSRTQYQYTLEDADAAELGREAPRVLAALRARPELHDVGSEQQDDGLQTTLTIDRTTAARLGITPALIDDTSTTPSGSGRSPPSSRS